MIFLRRKEDFDKMKEESFTVCEDCHEPKKFPCFCYFVVCHWNLEEEQAEYIYKEDLEEMLIKISSEE